MPPKRTAKSSSQGKKSEKKRKLDNGRGLSSNVNIESRNLSPLEQELERALHSNDSENSRVLYLAREVAKIPNVPPKLTMRVLQFCVKVGSEYVVRQFLTNQTIDLKTPEGGELLWAAVDEAQIEIAAMLVRSGADLNVRKTQGNYSFLHEVLKSYQIKDQAKKEELIRLMLDYGADVNACDNDGYSVLYEALHGRCSSELVEVLLQHGANITINEEIDLDDIFWASCYKPELLPKLVEHQVPDEQTRNHRGFLAIEHLLTRDKDKTAVDTLKLIKKILDLGVPVNTAGPFPGRRRESRACPLLSRALFSKKKDAVKLLLEYGADPHQPDDLGQTPLYQATAFAGYTHACRWLIERGADIHTPNDDAFGWYPIHGAYQHQSVKNLHLLLSLGADINVTDKRGLTPFQCCKDILKLKDYHCLCIKHFALNIAKGGKVSNDDMLFVEEYDDSRDHFKNCEQQLEQMKKECVCDNVPYFSLLSGNVFYTLRLMKNSDFVRNFKKSERKRTTLFPQYTWMLLHSFEIAEIRYNVLQRQEKLIKEASRNIFPDHIVENIALYSCLDKLERCSHDYYMNFHTNLKNTKADKEKIL